MEKNKRYIYDALYGIVHLPDFVWDVIESPELQRLREIRLCNINSLCLTGGANINRFEHAIGTLFLATKCLESWWFKRDISEKEKKLFLLATLLHDVANGPFGHSIEYIEKRRGFNPEDAFTKVVLSVDSVYTYRENIHEAIYFNNYRLLAEILGTKLNLTHKDIEVVGSIINGEGRYGKLINNILDLDNIDNVYRLAYHIGIVKSGENPLKLAQSLFSIDDELRINDESLYLIEDWYNVRKELYNFLLLNPDEFAGKCMLSDAIENSLQASKNPFKWFYTDYELLQSIKDINSENEFIISRLMTGDLYGCVGIFSSNKIRIYEKYIQPDNKKKLEDRIQNMLKSDKKVKTKSFNVSIHLIKDVNKTQRQIKIKTQSGKSVTIGTPTKRILIGIFFKNVDLSMKKILQAPPRNYLYIIKLIKEVLISEFHDSKLITLELYGESQ